MTMSTNHCLLPWKVRHAAWTVNRYVIHSDGYTSFEGRSGRNYERAICELGDTLYFTFHRNTRNFQKQTYECRNASGSEKLPKPEKSTSQRKQAYRKYEQYADYNRLRIRPRTTKQSFRHTLGATTEHIQPSFATLLDTQL